MTRFGIALAAAAMMTGSAQAVELDPKIVGFKLPDQIQWTENTRGGNRSVVLQGDPMEQIGSWFSLLGAFNLIYWGLGFLLFPRVIED